MAFFPLHHKHLETPHGTTKANASVADERNPMPLGEEEATINERRGGEAVRIGDVMRRARMGGKRQSTEESTSR